MVMATCPVAIFASRFEAVSSLRDPKVEIVHFVRVQHSSPSLTHCVQAVEPAFAVNADPHVTALPFAPPFAHVLASQHSFSVHVLLLQVTLPTFFFGTTDL